MSALPTRPVAPVPPPARTGDPSRRNLAFVAAAALLVVAGVVAAILLLNTGEDPADGVSQGGVDNPTSEQAQPQEPSSQEPSETEEKPIPANGAIDFSQAGQLVIDYYGDVKNSAKRWGMLSTNAQALFGDQDAFDAYWAQFAGVSSQNANGVTQNADGSVNVPVDVTYTKGSSPSQQHQTIRVTRVNGKLVIDSQAR